MKNFYKICLALAILLFPLYKSQAATLYFDPAEAEYGLGDQFAVDLRLDLAENEDCINTVDAAVNFDKSVLEVVDFGTGDSFLSLWLSRPTSQKDFSDINQQQQLKFTGGIPGGYCGKIPGDQGVSNILGKVIFKVINSDNKGQASSLLATKLSFDPASQVLKNDGQGSPAQLALKDARLTITSKRADQKSDWDDLKKGDYLPPEAFDLQILRNPNIFEGKYYLMFNTTDKQSGIDHYEVSETPLNSTVMTRLWDGLLSVLPGYEDSHAGWHPATPPYVLKDQKLNSTIKVKAVDKAGNQRISEYQPQARINHRADVVALVVFVLILLLVIFAVAMLVRRLISRRKNDL